MTIKVGDRLPDVKFRTMGPEGPKARSTSEVFGGRKVVLFGVPGAFTPGCSRRHLPGYIENFAAIKGKGADAVAVTAVNDAFVMDAWSKSSGGDNIEFLADGSAEFAKAAGLDLDASAGGMGVRSKRYAMIVEDGVVKHLAIEEAPSNITVSAAESILSAL